MGSEDLGRQKAQSWHASAHSCSLRYPILQLPILKRPAYSIICRQPPWDAESMSRSMFCPMHMALVPAALWHSREPRRIGNGRVPLLGICDSCERHMGVIRLRWEVILDRTDGFD